MFYVGTPLDTRMFSKDVIYILISESTQEEVLRQLQELQEKYPENLNDNYRCYWWCTCDLDGNILTYYLTLRDNIFPESEDENNICLRAHSSDPESLENLLKLYLETCKY